MAWTSLAKRDVGTNAPKSWLDAFIDNLTHLYNLMGGAGTGAGGSLQNGSFENDVDLDGIPDGWTLTLFTGGSAAIESTEVAHGAKSFKFTSPGGSGNGGGYIDSADYITCSPNKPEVVDFLLKSSGADIRNKVDLLWYTAAKAYISTTNIYDDSTTNPTSWTRFQRTAMPPATAVFCKLRITGCDSSDVTAGTSYWDGVDVYAGLPIIEPIAGAIAEASTTNGSFTDVGSVSIPFQAFSSNSLVRITAIVQQKCSAGASSVARLRVGSQYSMSQAVPDTSYLATTFSFVIKGLSGSQALYLQLYSSDVAELAYGKVDANSIVYEVLSP